MASARVSELPATWCSRNLKPQIPTQPSTCVERLDCLMSLERAFLWDSDSSSRTGVWYDLAEKRVPGSS